MARYSDTLMEHFTDPRNRGALPERTHQGVVGTPGEGPYFILNLKVVGTQVVAATFECNACGITTACGSALTEWLVERPVGECRSFTAADLADVLDGLPADKRHCAERALRALQLALLPP